MDTRNPLILAISMLLAFLLVVAIVLFVIQPVYAEDQNATTAGYRIAPLQEKLSAITADDIKKSLLKYSDMGKHWGSNYVGKLFILGIVSGNGDGTFKPDSPVQADQFIKMTVRALGYALVEGKTDWSKVYIDIAKNNGLLLDKEIADYKKPVTREQMARIIVRASNTFNICPDSKYDNYVIGKIKDYQKISDNCKQFVIKAYELGLVTGSNGNFNPKAGLTRTEASTVIIRLLDKKELKPMVPEPDEVIRFQDRDGNWREVYPGTVREYFDIAKAMQNSIPLAKGFVSFGMSNVQTGGVSFYKDESTHINSPFNAIGLFNIECDDPIKPDYTSYDITVYNSDLYKQLFKDYTHTVFKVLFEKDADKAITLHDKYMNMANNTDHNIWEDTRLNNRKVEAVKGPGDNGFSFRISILGKK